MEKARRQEILRDVLRRNEIANQHQLMDLLWPEGVQCTQATISRDLREVGATKRDGHYVLPDGQANVRVLQRRLIQTVRGDVEAAERCGPMVVIQTRTGRGRAVTDALRSVGLPEMIAAIADGDTIFAACRGLPQANELCRLMARCIS